MNIAQFISQNPQLVVVLCAAAASLGTQAGKKFLDLQNDHVIVLLAVTLSTLTAALPIITNATQANPSAFGEYASAVFGVATAIYHGARVSQGFLSNYQIKRKEDAAQAAVIDSIGTSPILQPAAAVPSGNEFEG